MRKLSKPALRKALYASTAITLIMIVMNVLVYKHRDWHTIITTLITGLIITILLYFMNALSEWKRKYNKQTH